MGMGASRLSRGVFALACEFCSSLLDALAPALCVLCRGPPGGLPWLCQPCAASLTLLRAPLCLRCGAPRPVPAPLCANCPEWPPLLHAVRSAAPHAGAAKEIVHALKYGNNLAAGRPLGHLAAAAAAGLPLPGDAVVVPVPLHAARRRRRGFNQAEEIARLVARELGLPLRPRWLYRIRGDLAAAMRSRAGRWRAVRGAFRAKPAVKGRTVLLVDDVLTTGSTLAACTKALSRRGALGVWAVTATRALAGGGSDGAHPRSSPTGP